MAPAKRKRKAAKPALTLHKEDPAPVLVTPRDPRYSWSHWVAQDSGEVVVIHRDMEGASGISGTEADDPRLDVYFSTNDAGAYPEGEPPRMGDGWHGIRTSFLDLLIEGLLDARDAATRSGMLPRFKSEAEKVQEAIDRHVRRA
jgi:hypothetical protein